MLKVLSHGSPLLRSHRPSPYFILQKFFLHPFLTSGKPLELAASPISGSLTSCRPFCHSSQPQTSKQTQKKQNKKPSSVPSVTSTSSTTAPAATPTIAELRKALIVAFKNKQPRVVIETYFLARKFNLEFERADYLTIFRAFLTPSPGNIYYLNSAAFLVFERIKAEKLWTMDTFRYAVRLFENNNLVQELLELDQIFDSHFSPNANHTEMMLNAFISCSSETNAWTHYNIYRANTVLNCLSTSNTTPPPTSAPASESSPAKTQWDLPKPATFMTLCGLLCQKKLHLRAASVLRDFTEAYSSKGISEEEGEGARVGAVRMTPAIAATSPDTLFRTIELLNTALSSFEMTVLATVVNWIASENIEIPQGIIRKIFEVCAAMGRPDILEQAVQMQSQQGRILTPAEHAHLVVAYCRYGSIEKAVERLVIAEASGVNFTKGTFYPPILPDKQQQDLSSSSSSSSLSFNTSYTSLYLQNSLSRLLRTISDVDQLYYALVDLSSHGIRPPILALNAILLSSGYVASLDRAFSLLQEYHQLFHIKPSLESYCALVHAVGRATSTPPRVSVVVAVLQEMDSNDFQPNSYCYSILIEVILITEEEDHIKGIPGILSHMDDNAIQPSLRCLRRLAIFYAKRGNEEMVTEICNRIVAITKRSLPIFFLSRLNSIREKIKRMTPPPVAPLLQESSASSSSSTSSVSAVSSPL